MRTIKFQGVDDNNRLYDLHAINYANMTGLCQCEEVIGWVWCRFKEFRQFTEKIDINGKEIYEGDIVKTGYLVIDEWMEYNAVIQWNNHYAMFCQYINEDLNQMMDVEVEVIGNIYENPELLNQ